MHYFGRSGMEQNHGNDKRRFTSSVWPTITTGLLYLFKEARLKANTNTLLLFSCTTTHNSISNCQRPIRSTFLFLNSFQKFVFISRWNVSSTAPKDFIRFTGLYVLLFLLKASHVLSVICILLYWAILPPFSIVSVYRKILPFFFKHLSKTSRNLL